MTRCRGGHARGAGSVLVALVMAALVLVAGTLSASASSLTTAVYAYDEGATVVAGRDAASEGINRADDARLDHRRSVPGHSYDDGSNPARASPLLGGYRLAPNTALNPSGIRFSQTSVNNVDEIASSMRANGWVGDPVDVVRMPGGGLTTLDNSRVLAAHQAGINVQARVHAFDDLLPSGSVGRFTTPKGGAPTTWGDAVLNRIGAQNAPFRNRWPTGSPFTGWDGF